MENKNSSICYIDAEELKKSVPGNVYHYTVTDSTNTRAKLEENVPDKSVFIAEMQNAGKGRMGRPWSSPVGKGIWMSIYLEPEGVLEKISQITLLAGVATARAIPDTQIKWPNDVISDGKKIAGILTEMVSDGKNPNKVIVGVGINVNTEKFPEELEDKATSLYLKTGDFWDRTQLTKTLLEEFFDLYELFLKDGFLAVKDEYTKKCATLGKEVRIISRDGEKRAISQGITDDGELIVKTDSGVEIVNSGEVSVRGLLGYN